MKKRIVLLVIIAIILALGAWYIISQKYKETNVVQLEESEITKLMEESYLDILVNMQEYSKNNIDEQKLLEAGMRIAGNLELVKQSGKFQCVDKEDVHKIMSQLIGKKIDKPIVIEQFYYTYNRTSEVYNIIPMGTDWIHLDNVKSAKKIGNIYYIECSAKNIFEPYVDYIDNITLELKYMPNNDLVKYQINSIKSTQRLIYPMNAKDIQFDKIVEANKVKQKAKEYLKSNDKVKDKEPSAIELSYYDAEYTIKSNNNEEIIDIQNKLCWRLHFEPNGEMLFPVIMYFDAYTGEILGNEIMPEEIRITE